MNRSNVRFSVAGLEIALECEQRDGLEHLSGFYERYPSTKATPDLVLQIEIVPGYATGRARSAEYPAFRRELIAPGRIALSRFDAQGELVVPTEPAPGQPAPVRGHFRIGESTNTLEAVVRIGMSVALPRHGGLLVHASAIAVRERAYVFAGVSGAGKSTIAAMLTDASPARTKLSDELLIAAPLADARWAVHVAPFIGGHGLPHGARVPMAGVYFLEQAAHHECVRLSRTAGLRELLRHVLAYVAEAETAGLVLDAATRWIHDVPCHRLRFAKDPGVASVLGIT